MKKQFQAESKQLLELMIHSIYSQKDIFLRELISNASDAIDKRQFLSLQNEKLKETDYKIEIIIDEKKKTLSIVDNGIGMSEKDLENNLGTIAKSGTKEFIKKIKDDNDLDVIGQFGVGFYSSFIVSKKVEVNTKKLNSKALKWSSNGVKDYQIEEGDKKDIGTKITMFLKQEDDILEFLNKENIKALVKKYSDYVKYPIYLDGEVINSQMALWKKDKKDIKQEEYNEFYKSKYYDFNDPAHVIHVKAEGSFNYEFLGFIPSVKPFDYNSPNYKKGLDLYSKGILIDNNLDYLLPDSFNFVKGLVDSQDLNLNISREMLQKDSSVTKLSNLIEKKIQKELLNILNKKREEYNKIYDNFGRTITFGLYNDYGMKKDLVKDLVMFKSSRNNSYITFKEYLENNKENDFIYYAAGESIEKINQLPIMQKIKEKDIEILYFLNDVDEFAIQMLNNYDGKEFKSISSADFDIDSEKEKEELNKIKEQNKDLMAKVKESLDGKVDEVTLTSKLVDDAVCITSGDGLSMEMEKVLSSMNGNEQVKANKVLEINYNHDIFKKLKTIKSDDEIKKISEILYTQAMISEGFEVEDKKSYNALINNLIIEYIK